MNLDEQALNLFLYMYAMKDDIDGFKAVLHYLEIKTPQSINSLKMSFNTACDSDSKRVLKHILETPLIDYLDTEDFDKATVTASYKSNTDVMCLLISNEKVLNKLTFDSKLILSISQINNEKAFELIKCLIEKGKYKISKDGDDIFNIAKHKANENLIEYLFINSLAPGEQLPKYRSYEIMLTSQESISPIFLSLKEKLDIQFTESELSYLKTEKKDLYNLLEKKNLFDKLSVNLVVKEKESVKKMKI